MKYNRVNSLCRGIFLIALLVSCSSAEQRPQLKDQEIASVLGETLTTANLQKVMPFGLTEEDSVVWVSSYIKSWVTDILVADAASWDARKQQEIDQKVDQYRHQLIVEEYEKSIVERGFKRRINSSAIETVAHSTDEQIDSIGIDLNSEAELQVQFVKRYRDDLFNQAIQSGKAAIKDLNSH